MKVRLSMPAEMSLAYVIRSDKELGKRIYAQLEHRLPLDPYPDTHDDDDIFQSLVIQFLQRENYEVHRLKSKQFLGYRVFYIVDFEDEIIYILEIIRRANHTYDPDAEHIQIIKSLYIEYYTNKTKAESHQE